jgi:hypothetical protein
MELPDDVLRLVRAFAKPWFKYHKVYKRTVSIMRLTSCPELRTCLLEHPERILNVLVEFEKAYTEFVAHAVDKDLRNSEVIYSKQMEFYSKRKTLCVIQHKVHCKCKHLFYMKRVNFCGEGLRKQLL